MQVDDLFMFWEWVEYTFVPTLKPMYWYGPYTDPAEMALWTDQVLQMTRSKRRSRKMETKVKGGAQNVIKYVTADAKKYPKGFTADRATAYIVGVPRLRQLRVKHGKCTNGLSDNSSVEVFFDHFLFCGKASIGIIHNSIIKTKFYVCKPETPFTQSPKLQNTKRKSSHFCVPN